jgi:hypothetical protein
LVIAAFSVIGAISLLQTSAATYTASDEAERATLSSKAYPVSQADASDGNAVSFGHSQPSIYWGALPSGKPYCECNTQDAPWVASTYDRFEQNAGKKMSVVHWGQSPPWVQPFPPTPFEVVKDRGAITLLTMNSESVPLTDITAGKYDTSLTQWAKDAKTFGQPFFFRFNWEMNGAWYPWGQQAKADPSKYVAAWRHFHDIVTAQGATNVTWVWCPNIEYIGSTSLDSLYPGDAYVDWTCMDGYNRGTNPILPDSWKTFTQVMQPTYQKLQALAPTKPIMIAETSSSEFGGSKSGWITDLLTTELPQTFPRIKALVWFNWNIFEQGGHWDYHIESSPSAQEAFKNGIASPYYRQNVYGKLPPLTKVPEP